MKKDIRYFVRLNGLYFTFDYARRNHSILEFNTDDHFICSLDLNVSKLVFKDSYDTRFDTVYFFDIVPVGGASDGK